MRGCDEALTPGIGCEGIVAAERGAAEGEGASARGAGSAAGLAAFGGASALGGFGAAALGAASASLAFTGDGRAFRPRRCALPITALRETPPSSSAIWLAVDPPSHIFVSFSIRSSVQLIAIPVSLPRENASVLAMQATSR
jgi:hypothetical protein